MPNPEQPWLHNMPAPTEGVWHQHIISNGVTDWDLRCGAFHAWIRRVRDGNYYLTINMHPYGNDPDLAAQMRRAEEDIARRIEAVLPAYQVIKARLGVP